MATQATVLGAKILSFWRSGSMGTVKPDGVADTTESIRRDGNVGINTTPLSTHDVAGSIGHNLVSTAAPTYSAAATDYTINLTLVGVQAVTLPAPTTCTRRIIILRNATTALKTVTNYTDFTGSVSTSIPANTAIGVQSNGASWLQISLDSAILPTVFFSVSGAGGQSVGPGFNTLNMATVVASIGVPAGSYTAGLFTIPTTGIYQITGTLRWADGQIAGSQYGVGVHTSNSDGDWFLWSAIENTTTTTSRRTAYPYIRVARFTAGQQIRMFSYVDGPAMPINTAAMQVLLIA